MQTMHQTWRDPAVRHAPRRSPLAGPNAASRKYDVLTALATAGLAGTPAERATALRLIAMVTARYDWTSDTITFGQAELARLWSTSLRTAKREMKRLTGSGLLVCLVPGVRGRVGVYRLDRGALRRLTQGSWSSVGPDFAIRMQGGDEDAAQAVRVEFDGSRGEAHDAAANDAREAGVPEWVRLQRRLRAEDPAGHAAWYGRLRYAGHADGVLRIAAPSRFVASYVETHLAASLSAAVRACFEAPLRLVLCVGTGEAGGAGGPEAGCAQGSSPEARECVAAAP